MASSNPNLSIVILNYNVKDLLLDCLESVFKSKTEQDNWQVIVVDNASSDGSVEAVKEKYLRSHIGSGKLELVENKQNLGFAAGNNIGVKYAKAPVILFLNPDTLIKDHAISKSLEMLLSEPGIGALGCKVLLPNGKLDYSCHRGFPTPWNSFTYFSGLAKLFPNFFLFSGYTASHLGFDQPHEVDCISGTYLMVRKTAGEQIRFWDTDYFFNGEDIEFCYCLKEKGWKIYYYPDVQIIHFKGSSSGLRKSAGVKVDKATKLLAAQHAAFAMRIFYKKHYYNKYLPIWRDLILGGIKLLELIRRSRITLGFGY